MLIYTECPPVPVSGRQRQVQLMRIRQRDAQRRPQLGTYRHRKPLILKRYAGDVLAPVSFFTPNGNE